MPFIQNISMSDARQGFHHYPGPNSILIQITDPASEPPKPAQEFKEIHHFEFLDIEPPSEGWQVFGIQPEQCRAIVTLLKHALENDMNVVVHCHAGLCRSGAVTEVGVTMGFQDTCCTRIPNIHVKHGLMRELGWTYDSEEKPYEKFADPTFGGILLIQK